MTVQTRHPSAWPMMLAAAGILLLNMGARQSLGLFVVPLERDGGHGLVGISFAFAISQLVWGAVQPVFGVAVERFGSFRVIVFGSLLVALGTGLTPLADSSTGLALTLGVLAAAGAGAGSFSLLIGWLATHLPDHRRAFAAGFINAGSSLGQFLFAPLTQWLIDRLGWIMALEVLAVSALAVIPLAALLARLTGPGPREVGGTAQGLGTQLRVAMRDRSYLLIHIGFFTCGFHIGFLVTHLPGEVALCSLAPQVSARALALIGLFNIAGSLAAGWGCQHLRMKLILAAMYVSRTLIIAAFVFSPRTDLTFYALAAALGFTWLATVPPTAGLIGKLFGPRHLATLFGLALLTHQVGGFFGAWLGGIALSRYGDYGWMWTADAMLALLAAALHLPIREARPAPRPAAA